MERVELHEKDSAISVDKDSESLQEHEGGGKMLIMTILDLYH